MIDQILVVDDNEQNCEMMTDLLTNWGYRVNVACQGKEAISKIYKVKPDIILLDVMLPGMNGFEVCQELKNDPQTCDIPIIMLSVLNDVEDHIRGYKVGAEFFMSKPVNYNELKYKIISLIKQKKLMSKMEESKRIVFSFLEILKGNNDKIYKHTSRVQDYCNKVSGLIRLSEDEHERLIIGAYFHDIGKIVMQDTKDHVLAGERIIEPLKMSDWLRPFVRNHHERINGSGFPDGLSGKDLPQGVWILAAVDRFVELWERNNDKFAAFSLLNEEIKEGYYDEFVGRALEQVLKDERFIENFRMPG